MTRAAQRLVTVAALALPTYQRARYREQWLADLRDAESVGVSHGDIVRGALGFAAGSLTRSLIRREIRASFSWVQVVIIAALIGIFVYVMFPEDSLLSGHKVVLRDHLDVFSELMNTPFVYLSPVLVVLLSCTRFARELTQRFVSATRTRVRVESYVLAKLIVGCGTAFVVFFVWTFLAFVIAFAVWPLLGDPSIDPAQYDLTSVSAVADSMHRTTYSQLIDAGPWVYGVLYAAWVGFAASVYAALGMAALAIVKRRAVAMAIPFLVFFIESVGFEVAGYPFGALYFSMFPFGLVQSSVLTGALPSLVLAGAVAIVWMVLLRQLARLDNLA